MRQLLKSPQWTKSYQGNVEYIVGYPAFRNGRPTVQIRHHYGYNLIKDLQNPDDFWNTKITEIGAIFWRYCPWQKAYFHSFPDKEINELFPGYPCARYAEDGKVEVEGEFPQIIATREELETPQNYSERQISTPDPIVWQGKSSELTKELFFTTIFPFIYPPYRSEIITHLIKCQITIPVHPDIPNEPYIYQIYQNTYQLRLERTYQPTQFFNLNNGWVEDEKESTNFYGIQNAKKMLSELDSTLQTSLDR